MSLMRFERNSVQTFAPSTMQLLGSSLPDAMVAVDRKGVICVWNEKATSLFGYTADEVMGQSIFALFPQLRSMHRHLWRELAQQKSIDAFLLELTHQDGHELLVELSATLWVDEENNICGAISLWRNRGPQSKTPLNRSGVEDEQPYLDVILEQTQDAIMFTDAAHCITYVNPAWEDLNGYRMSEVQGQPASFLESDKTAPTVLAEMRQTLSRGQAFQGEVWNRCKDGSCYQGILSIFPIRDEDGYVSDFIGVIRNVSAEKLLLQAQEQFVADISHELRTPLTNIKFYLSLLEKGRQERYSVYMSTLKREADRLHYMIEGLLDLAQMDQGYADFRFDALDLNAILRTFTERYASTAQSKGLALTFVAEENLPFVWGDIKYLEQVAFHLLENAIRYTPDGGSIVVSTFVCSDKTDSCEQGEAERKRCVCFSVQDTGLGIPTDEHSRIFERFYRGRNARQLTLPGTGLGLSISREIILRHEGALDMVSQVGKGSTFTVRLKPAQ